MFNYVQQSGNPVKKYQTASVDCLGSYCGGVWLHNFRSIETDFEDIYKVFKKALEEYADDNGQFSDIFAVLNEAKKVYLAGHFKAMGFKELNTTKNVNTNNYCTLYVASYKDFDLDFESPED